MTSSTAGWREAWLQLLHERPLHEPHLFTLHLSPGVIVSLTFILN